MTWVCPLWAFLTGLGLMGAENGKSPIVPQAQVWFAEEFLSFLGFISSRLFKHEASLICMELMRISSN